jgi:hypothetical protein
LNSTIDSIPTREDLRELKTIVKHLHSMSQHSHTSALELVDFGSNTLGICGATPTDLMHAFLEGVLKYLLRLVIESIPESKKSQIDILDICLVTSEIQR